VIKRKRAAKASCTSAQIKWNVVQGGRLKEEGAEKERRKGRMRKT